MLVQRFAAITEAIVSGTCIMQGPTTGVVVKGSHRRSIGLICYIWQPMWRCERLCEANFQGLFNTGSSEKTKLIKYTKSLLKKSTKKSLKHSRCKQPADPSCLTKQKE